MRKLFSFNMVTLDGFFEGPHREIDWHNVDTEDGEFNEFAIEQMAAMDTLLFGRVTYQLMASYWPTPAAIEGDPIVAGLMNRLPKVVVSRTLDKAEMNCQCARVQGQCARFGCARLCYGLDAIVRSNPLTRFASETAPTRGAPRVETWRQAGGVDGGAGSAIIFP